jgi:hypothetical protein
MNDALIALAARYRSDGTILRSYGDARGADLLDRVAVEIENAVTVQADELLSLTSAAHETGLHPDSIGRAVRDGRVPNHGRPNAPKVRRGDLTTLRSNAKQRDRRLTRVATVGISASQIARAVVTSSKGGRDG